MTLWCGLLWTAGNPLDEARWPGWLRSARFLWSKAQQNKSLFVPVRSCSSSDLFAREQRLARWILFSGPARLRRMQCLYRNPAPPTKMSSKTSEWSNVGKRLSGVLFRMSNSLFLVKLIGKTLLKTGQMNKNCRSTKEQQTEAAMRDTILFNATWCHLCCRPDTLRSANSQDLYTTRHPMTCFLLSCVFNSFLKRTEKFQINDFKRQSFKII